MLKELLSNLPLTTVLTFVNSFLLVYFVIPNIRAIIKTRRLTDIPDERSSHKEATPTIAVVAFFITLILTLFFIQNFDDKQIGINIIAAVSMIFMVALKDDLVLVPPKTMSFMMLIHQLYVFEVQSQKILKRFNTTLTCIRYQTRILKVI